MSTEKPRDTSGPESQGKGTETTELTDEQLASISGGPAQVVTGDIPKTGTEGSTPMDPGLMG